MASSRMPLLLCVLFVAMVCQNSMGFPVPDDDGDSWADSVKNAFNKAKDTVKNSFDTASDKISEIGENIKKSDTYGQVSEHLHNVGEKLSKAGENIKESDAFKNVKDTFQKGVENVKEKLDD